MNTRTVATAGTLFLTLCVGLGQAAEPIPPAPPTDRYLDQFIDTSVRPGEDFNRYAVGKWLKDHPIPADEKSWGIAKVVQEETYQRLQKLSNDAAASNAPRGTNAQKIGDFWFTAMDTATIDKQRASALQPELDRIAAVKDRASLLAAAAHLQYLGVGPLLNLAIAQDEKNSDAYAVHLWQGGIGLPDRDYYFDDDARTRKIRDEYVQHVRRMLGLLGDDAKTATAGAATIMRMETDLARASRKLADLRDPIANYHKMKLDEVSKLTPSIRWGTVLGEANIRDVDQVIVGQPEFLQQLEKSLGKESLANWKTYLRWHLIHSFASELSADFEAEDFRFFGTVMNGTPQQRPRWKRMLDEEDAYLGEALGQLYVRDYFSPATKARYEKLTDDIFAAFADRIRALDWMDEATKQAALKKLAAVTKKVGYPAKWKDYSQYELDRTSFVGNVMRGRIWQSERLISKLHQPVDRSEWEMTPQTYNAYYNPSNNEIVLPAAIFILPGIDDANVDDALVYSYAGGTTIGHEITHGFDDEGRQFDEKGNLRDWWTPRDQAEFRQRAAGIVRQFNAYVAVDDLHVNGEATQGENIADLGGINLGWDAFTKTDEYRSGRTIGGYTPAQRYFVGWALGWMRDVRPEALAVAVKTDVHAPSFLRTNGPVSNMAPFYDAFGVKPGDAMYRAPADRVRIW